MVYCHGTGYALRNWRYDWWPLVWKVMVEKPGKVDVLKNLRPITLISTMMKGVENIENVLIKQGKIIISIKFVSEHFKNNDESTILKKKDIWSFEKPIKSKNPNWLLCST